MGNSAAINAIAQDVNTNNNGLEDLKNRINELARRLGQPQVEFKQEVIELNEYVNYDMHWDKIFYSKINDIFTVCGLNIDNTPNIFDFF